MKKQITRAELEAIGENWLQRRNRLLEYAHRKDTPIHKSMKAWMLAWSMNQRVTKIIVFLGQQKARAGKDFPPGGISSNTPPGEAEFVVRNKAAIAFAAGKTFPGLIALEKECANCCAVQPEWESDFKKIRQNFYSVERATNGTDILQEIRRRLLSMETATAKRLLDKALDLQ